MAFKTKKNLILNVSMQVKLILTKDGSGQGGAFGAVSALRQTARDLRSA